MLMRFIKHIIVLKAIDMYLDGFFSVSIKIDQSMNTMSCKTLIDWTDLIDGWFKPLW